MNSTGFGSIPHYIHPEDLGRMQRFVRAAMQKSRNEYIGFGGPDAVAGSGLDELYHWSARLEMCQWRRETLDKESIWDEARSTNLSRW